MSRVILQSGATKRRTVSENNAKLKNVLSRNTRMTDFLTIIKEQQNPSSSEGVNEVLSSQISYGISDSLPYKKVNLEQVLPYMRKVMIMMKTVAVKVITTIVI